MKLGPAVVISLAMLLGHRGGQARSLAGLQTAPPAAPVQAILPQNVTPICFDRSNIPTNELHWLYFPDSPSELATNEDYAFLSGQLIRGGVVDASECPLGGVWPDGYATACGLAKSHDASRYLQNVFDDEILAAGKDIGVPPIMIKQLIRYESQFWPVQWGPYHFGLAHITHPGAATALFWNRDLYEATSAAAPGSGNLPSSLLALMNAYCPTCSGGLDIPKAERSIPLIAQSLLAYCKQTTQIIYNATRISPADVVDYPTVWKLTLLNYNAGPDCAFDAVKLHYSPGTKLSWVGIADKLPRQLCVRGVGYVDSITEPYYTPNPRP